LPGLISLLCTRSAAAARAA
jgi:hypothetical protein